MFPVAFALLKNKSFANYDKMYTMLNGLVKLSIPAIIQKDF